MYLPSLHDLIPFINQFSYSFVIYIFRSAVKELVQSVFASLFTVKLIIRNFIAIRKGGNPSARALEDKVNAKNLYSSHV